MRTVATGEMPRERFREACPDGLAFAVGLLLAWAAGWKTADLIWSLWLSSLTVGYVTIVWGALGPAVLQFRAKRDRRSGVMRRDAVAEVPSA